ncbi:MAG: ribosome silencing factor [Candidatus Margulisbacteria bacterium]|nr:ribosome silencing factor [Candidatus Margulisiibacteriota bacterium]
MNSEAYIKRICEVASEKKAMDICVYELKVPVLSDTVIVLSVKNHIHAKATAVELVKEVRKNSDVYSDLSKPTLTGDAASGWVILDMGNMIVHIMDSTMRQMYEIDLLLESQAVVYHI